MSTGSGDDAPRERSRAATMPQCTGVKEASSEVGELAGFKKLNLAHMCFIFRGSDVKSFFPAKYTTFHVTHTNPAAISPSLNRAESLYLSPPHRTPPPPRSLAERAAAVVQPGVWMDASYRPTAERKATELCLSLTLSPAWPRPPLLYSPCFSIPTRLYLTLLHSS